MEKVIKINTKDNVAVALVDLKKNDIVTIDNKDIKLAQDISNSHKFSIELIKQNSQILKYGMPIGFATEDIALGSWVHTHNVKTLLNDNAEYSYNPKNVELLDVNKTKTFNGFVRPDGEVGVRNELWIVPMVGCINKAATLMINEFKQNGIPDGIDDIIVLEHPYGCSQLGEDHLTTQKILSGLVHHPNAGGVLVLGLGCENNTIESFKEVLGNVDSKRVKFLVAQDVEDEVEDGVKLLNELANYAKEIKREAVPLSKLKIGLKCGASDGLSGITANPLVGEFSDLLVKDGGISILTEVPEMFGAETLLMNRCVSNEVFEKTVGMVNDFKDYFRKYNQTVYENPSPGNKKGGISTLEDKSLGCVQKGGTSPVIDVLSYGEQIKKSGLNLLTGPGNDMVAVTALVASGAQIVLFTTGRGTPFGGPVPTIKVGTNTEIIKKKSKWIDYNAGQLIEGISMSELAQDFYSYVMDTVNGNIKVWNEKKGYKEISIFKDGVTL